MTGSTLKPKEQLGQRLIARGVVSIEDIESALSEQQFDGHHRLLGEILVAMGSCSESQIAQALAESYGVPYAHITPELCDPKVFEILPRAFIEENLVLPIFRVKNTLTVALCEPANLFLIDQIKQMTGFNVQGVCATAKDIRAAIQAFCPREKTYNTHKIVYEGFDPTIKLLSNSEQTSDSAGMDTLPIIQQIDRLLCKAVDCQASDVYFEPDEASIRIRFRVEGKLVEKKRFNGIMQETILSHFRAIANLIEPATPKPQDSLIRLSVNGRTVEFRIFILPGVWGDMIALHASDPERLLYGLESLGLTLETLTQLQRIIQKPKGLVLVAGPPRNGRKTALYAMLRHCCRDEVQICTVEDSILSRIPGINQFAVPIGSANANAQATLLQYVIQQHPDVIMVNEIYNAETALLCIKAANTGMRVFAGIQAPDAIMAIDHLIKLGVPAYGLSDALNASLALRLVPKVCAHCKIVDSLSEGTRLYLDDIGYHTKDSVFRGSGCHHCRHTGYAGNIGIHELVETDQESRRCILQGTQSNMLRSWSESHRHRSLLEDGMDKAIAGLVVLDDVIYSVSN